MAPNRKQLTFPIDHLVSTEPLVQAKYLPLTALDVEAPTVPVVPTQPTVIRSNIDSYDYWYEPNVVQEPTKSLFSADYLVSNLKQDVEQRETCTTPLIRAPVSDSSDYWAERVQAHNNAAAAVETTGYWDWPADASVVQIALILKEQLASQHGRKERSTTTPSSQAKPEHDAYWLWKEDGAVRNVSTEAQEAYWEWNTEASELRMNEEMVATFVAHEIVRCMFAIGHIQANLVKDAASVTVPASLQEANDAYWCWPAQEDDYWNESPPSLVQRAEAMPVQGYWVW